MSEKIEIGYRKLASFGGVEYYHKFLIYTDSNGKQYTISGWPDEQPTDGTAYGKMQIDIDQPYDSTNKDYSSDPSMDQYREAITEGDDLSSVWNGILENALTKDDLYPYDPLRQNSNSLADTLLKDAGLNAPEDDNLFNPLDPQSVPLEAFDEKLKDWLDGDISDNIITLDTITVYANYEPSWGENTLNWISATWNSTVNDQNFNNTRRVA